MATIEPRLMHLLNEPPSDLPPLQVFAFAKSAGRPAALPPLEPDASSRGDKPAPTAQHAAQQIPPIYGLADEGPSRHHHPRSDIDYLVDREWPRQSAHPLRMLLDDPGPGPGPSPGPGPDAAEPSHSLRHILVDAAPEAADDSFTKKRHRALTVKEDFVQLPQPLKKQKSSQQVVPPIINGLHEPPPNAGVFPPISGSFDESDGRGAGLRKEFGAVEERAAAGTAAEGDRASAVKAKRRAAKPRRKWSEEETNHLLLGVSRHGVGKWTNILEDPDFRFNDRTAGDLKDRFRTCCPDELRSAVGGKPGAQDRAAATAPEPRAKTKTALMLESILTEPDEPPEKEKPSSSQQDSDSGPKQRRSRAHRKKIEDLEHLGIRGPFKKSHRRERRLFTEQDDKEILEGLDRYGPAWTKIQRDPRFNLSSRQPTDLRDRVRNKYPDIYARIEKGNFQVQDPPKGNGLLEPSVTTTIENSLNTSKAGPLEPHLSRTGSKEDMPKWPAPASAMEPGDSVSGAPSHEAAEPTSSGFIAGVVGGEMDISRLLLDDSARE